MTEAGAAANALTVRENLAAREGALAKGHDSLSPRAGRGQG